MFTTRLRRIASLLLVFGLCGAAHAEEEGTLYDELGGKKGVQQIVHELILQMAESEAVKPHFKTINIAGFRARLEAFICETADGPCEYNGRSMREAHATMSITRPVFNHLVADLIAAMDIAEIDYAAQNDLLARLALTEPDIVMDKPFDRSTAGEPRPRSLDDGMSTRLTREHD